MTIPVWGLLAGGTITAFAVAAMLNIVSVAVPALRPESAAEPVPDDAGKVPAETAVR